MDFAYEVLGDEKFQKFCQAILVGLFPNVQCLPVGQPDGGRDAFIRNDVGLIIFQVKFSKNPLARKERDAIASLISAEGPKVDALIKRGATAYYLLTNVSGTSHPNVGSIDSVNEELTRAFGIPSYVWWQDDLDRRLEASKDLLWRYPELARGQDFLEYLAKERGEQKYTNSAHAFRAYMVAQHAREEDVKFQQVQIQNKLLDLFTDTPIGQARDKIPTRNSLAMSSTEHEEFEAFLQRRRHIDTEAGNMLAANWLLSRAPSKGLQRIVLEGAPGQGKSTVTQYLCQVHRTVALQIDLDSERIPTKHRESTLRLPIRVDLRDFALWLTGKDPLASEKGIPRPEGMGESLEELITHQIHRHSGGLSFSVSDLSILLQGSNFMLVLDGFDEVADPATRSRLIEQINVASARMGSNCLSMQAIVTSRPAAFIMSSGFSEREWAHLSLLPMQRQQIIEYTDKWILARGVAKREGSEFKELLLDRISRPHIRSLAQNPMQLAILLNLISTKGMSLPDKRTALYDSYMDLFFGREAEKDETVRENRDILFQIHQYVAWMLQIDAEVPGGTGSISQADLEKLVANFLTEKEHKEDVLKLFKGAVERVGALVSRVQGMLEFEVQPLREYFAGKFLYATAPYSPAGAERRGTRPDRFAALARRPYWSNVIRFYAGCYSSGELLSLVAGLEELSEDSDFALRIHALQLAVLFLTDYVFAQEPKTVRRVIGLIIKDNNLRYLLADRTTWEESRLALPDRCGRADLARAAYSEVAKGLEAGFMARLGSLLMMNATTGDRFDFWQRLDWSTEKSFAASQLLGLFFDADETQLESLAKKFGARAFAEFIQSGGWDRLSTERRVEALNYSVETLSEFHFSRGWGGEIREDRELFLVQALLNPYNFSFLSYVGKSDLPLAAALDRYAVYSFRPPQHDTFEYNDKNLDRLNDIVHACFRATQISMSKWKSEILPWSDLIESARRTWGDKPRIIMLACLAAGIKSKAVRAAGFSDLLDDRLPMAERARYARLKSSLEWWDENLQKSNQKSDIFLVLLLLLCWAPGAVIKGLLIKISNRFESLDADFFLLLLSSINLVISLTAEGRTPITGLREQDLDVIPSVRIKAALLPRFPKALGKKILFSLLSNPISDANLMHHLAHRAIDESIRDPKSWTDTISFFISNKSVLSSLPESPLAEPIPYFERTSGMPSSAVKAIVSNPSMFPARMLELAEGVFASTPRDRISTLSEMSSKEEWFS